MSIAAVPNYLQDHDFSSASPGMRFGLLLPIWTNLKDQEAEIKKRASAKSKQGQELSRLLEEQGMEAAISFLRNQKSNPLPGLWDKNDFAARQAWGHIKADKGAIKAIAGRQSAIIGAIPDPGRLSLSAIATAPFTTGLGNEHPLENGFAFLNPYGLPYLPGSGVKGVLRQAARELASGDWGDSPWQAFNRSLSGVEANAPDFDSAQSATYLDALFGREDSNDALRGALSFWDVIPQIKGDSLMVEIMTPHQGHYYQQKPAAGSTSPHDSGQPIPISYLTVPPGSVFTFHVVCDLAHLERIAPELARDGRWKTLVTAAFEHAFAWCGFGAKTAVGYGAMVRDHLAEEAAVKVQAKQETEAHLATLTPNRQAVEKFKQAMAARCQQLNGRQDRQNTEYHQKAQTLAKAAREDADWTPEDKRAAADAIAEWLPKVVERIDKDALKKLKLSALRGEV